MKELNELKMDLRNVARERDWEQFHTPKNLALALGGEVGELFELLQWKKDDELLKLCAEEKTKVSHELADVLVYLVRLADVLQIDLSTAVTEKMILNKEKYPVDKAKGNAKKYDQL